MTEYRSIEGFPGYRVGDDGSVWSCKTTKGRTRDTWKRLNPSAKATGHLHVGLMPAGGSRGIQRFVHRLVIVAFKGPPKDGEECRHIDGNPANNVPSNLEWGTRKQNVADAIKHGTAIRGERVGSAVLTKQLVQEIRAAYVPGVIGYKQLATRYGVAMATVVSVVRRETWKHVE